MNLFRTPVLRVSHVFWTVLIDERSVREALDSLSFHFLNDALFMGDAPRLGHTLRSVISADIGLDREYVGPAPILVEDDEDCCLDLARVTA